MVRIYTIQYRKYASLLQRLAVAGRTQDGNSMAWTWVGSGRTGLVGTECRADKNLGMSDLGKQEWKRSEKRNRCKAMYGNEMYD